MNHRMVKKAGQQFFLIKPNQTNRMKEITGKTTDDIKKRSDRPRVRNLGCRRIYLNTKPVEHQRKDAIGTSLGMNVKSITINPKKSGQVNAKSARVRVSTVTTDAKKMRKKIIFWTLEMWWVEL